MVRGTERRMGHIDRNSQRLPGKGWVRGLEPPTSGTTIQCSNQLSYTHHKNKLRILIRLSEPVNGTPGSSLSNHPLPLKGAFQRANSPCEQAPLNSPARSLGKASGRERKSTRIREWSANRARSSSTETARPTPRPPTPPGTSPAARPESPSGGVLFRPTPRGDCPTRYWSSTGARAA